MKIEKQLKEHANNLIRTFQYQDEFVIDANDSFPEPWITENALMCLVYLAENEGKKALSLYQKLKNQYQEGELYKYKPSYEDISIPGSIVMGLPAVALGHKSQAEKIYSEINKIFHSNKYLEDYLFNISARALLDYALKNKLHSYALEQLKEFENQSGLYRNLKTQETISLHSNALAIILLGLFDKKEALKKAEKLLAIKSSDIQDQVAVAFMCLALTEKKFGDLKFEFS